MTSEELAALEEAARKRGLLNPDGSVPQTFTQGLTPSGARDALARIPMDLTPKPHGTMGTMNRRVSPGEVLGVMAADAPRAVRGIPKAVGEFLAPIGKYQPFGSSQRSIADADAREANEALFSDDNPNLITVTAPKRDRSLVERIDLAATNAAESPLAQVGGVLTHELTTAPGRRLAERYAGIEAALQRGDDEYARELATGTTADAIFQGLNVAGLSAAGAARAAPELRGAELGEDVVQGMRALDAPPPIPSVAPGANPFDGVHLPPGDTADSRLAWVRHDVESMGGGPEAEARFIASRTKDLAGAPEPYRSLYAADIAAVESRAYLRGAPGRASEGMAEAYPEIYGAASVDEAPRAVDPVGERIDIAGVMGPKDDGRALANEARQDAGFDRFSRRPTDDINLDDPVASIEMPRRFFENTPNEPAYTPVGVGNRALENPEGYPRSDARLVTPDGDIERVDGNAWRYADSSGPTMMEGGRAPVAPPPGNARNGAPQADIMARIEVAPAEQGGDDVAQQIAAALAKPGATFRSVAQDLGVSVGRVQRVSNRVRGLPAPGGPRQGARTGNVGAAVSDSAMGNGPWTPEGVARHDKRMAEIEAQWAEEAEASAARTQRRATPKDIITEYNDYRAEGMRPFEARDLLQSDYDNLGAFPVTAAKIRREIRAAREEGRLSDLAGRFGVTEDELVSFADDIATPANPKSQNGIARQAVRDGLSRDQIRARVNEHRQMAGKDAIGDPEFNVIYSRAKGAIRGGQADLMGPIMLGGTAAGMIAAAGSDAEAQAYLDDGDEARAMRERGERMRPWRDLSPTDLSLADGEPIFDFPKGEDFTDFTGDEAMRSVTLANGTQARLRYFKAPDGRALGMVYGVNGNVLGVIAPAQDHSTSTAFSPAPRDAWAPPAGPGLPYAYPGEEPAPADPERSGPSIERLALPALGYVAGRWGGPRVMRALGGDGRAVMYGGRSVYPALGAFTGGIAQMGLEGGDPEAFAGAVPFMALSAIEPAVRVSGLHTMADDINRVSGPEARIDAITQAGRAGLDVRAMDAAGAFPAGVNIGPFDVEPALAAFRKDLLARLDVEPAMTTPAPAPSRAVVRAEQQRLRATPPGPLRLEQLDEGPVFTPGPRAIAGPVAETPDGVSIIPPRRVVGRIEDRALDHGPVYAADADVSAAQTADRLDTLAPIDLNRQLGLPETVRAPTNPLMRIFDGAGVEIADGRVYSPMHNQVRIMNGEELARQGRAFEEAPRQIESQRPAMPSMTGPTPADERRAERTTAALMADFEEEVQGEAMRRAAAMLGDVGERHAAEFRPVRIEPLPPSTSPTRALDLPNAGVETTNELGISTTRPIRVIESPTPAQVDELAAEGGLAWGRTEDGRVFAWPFRDGFHQVVERGLGVRFDPAFASRSDDLAEIAQVKRTVFGMADDGAPPPPVSPRREMSPDEARQDIARRTDEDLAEELGLAPASVRWLRENGRLPEYAGGGGPLAPIDGLAGAPTRPVEPPRAPAAPLPAADLVDAAPGAGAAAPGGVPPRMLDRIDSIFDAPPANAGTVARENPALEPLPPTRVVKGKTLMDRVEGLDRPRGTVRPHFGASAGQGGYSAAQVKQAAEIVGVEANGARPKVTDAINRAFKAMSPEDRAVAIKRLRDAGLASILIGLGSAATQSREGVLDRIAM